MKKLGLLTILILVGTILSYNWSYQALAGFLDRTEWATSGVLTNWTLGFALFWPGMGACAALLARKYSQRLNMSPKKARILMVWSIAILMLVMAYLMSLIGFQGFRLT